jgi:hypothetical protein
MFTFRCIWTDEGYCLQRTAFSFQHSIGTTGTRVTFGPASEIMETKEPDFDGMLNTPNQELILFDANEPQYAIARVLAFGSG